MRKHLFFLCLATLICQSETLYAFVPIQSYLLGDFSKEELEQKEDPLNYIFRYQNKDLSSSYEDFKYKNSLIQLMGLVWEGENLKQFCQRANRPRYTSNWKQEQAMRAMMATVQYIGLDLSTRAIAKYAKLLEFSSDEFENLSKNLVGNYCSPNVSVVSLRELKNNLDLRFKKGDFKIPSVVGNPYFPKGLSTIASEKDIYEKELAQSVKLFRSSCSWSGRVEQKRLLAPLFKNEVLMAFIIRQMSKKKIIYNAENKQLSLTYDPKSVQVSCENFICRKVSEEKFDIDVPKALGTTGYEDDFKRLYCSSFRHTDPFPTDENKTVEKWIKSESLSDHKFLISHFLALVTGVPDFLGWAEDYSKGKDIARASVDHSWDEWAEVALSNLSKEIYYEEPLTVDVVSSDYYLSKHHGPANLGLVFDVNLGEFDRLNAQKGKLQAQFFLRVDKNFLGWVRQQWKELDPTKYERREIIHEALVKHITDQVKQAKKLYVLSPWTEALEDLMARELISKLASYEGRFFDKKENIFIEIPVVFNYGVFALQYIHYKFKTARETNL